MGNRFLIPYYVDGEMIIIEGDTLEEVIEKIEDNTIYLKQGKVEEETLVLE